MEEYLESVPEDLDEEGLAWYANSYLINSCEYDYEALALSEDSDRDDIEEQKLQEAGSAFGAIVNGKAICAGYPRAYQLLLNRVGVSCVYISGQGSPLVNGKRSGRVDHAWNAVSIKYTWLMTDVTWNDSTGNASRYFNLPIKEMYQDHNAMTIDLENFKYLLVFTDFNDDYGDNIFLPE